LALDALRQRVTVDDGYLPNGRAEDVDASGWATFLAELRRSGWPLEVGGDPLGDWPGTAAAAENASTLRVQPSHDVQINIFPSWGTDSIWFDFSLRDMQRQEDADALMAFLRLLGRAVQRDVLLSHEGADEMVFAHYVQAQDAVVWTEAR
jgi:hypothetical protein